MLCTIQPPSSHSRTWSLRQGLIKCIIIIHFPAELIVLEVALKTSWPRRTPSRLTDDSFVTSGGGTDKHNKDGF